MPGADFTKRLKKLCDEEFRRSVWALLARSRAWARPVQCGCFILAFLAWVARLPAETLEVRDHNFSITLPADWSSLDPQPPAVLVARNLDSSVNLMVVAVKIPDQERQDPAGAMRAGMKKSMRSQGWQFEADRPAVLGGLPCVRMSARQGKLDNAIVAFTTGAGNEAYVVSFLLGLGSKSDDPDIQSIVQSFRLLTPAAVLLPGTPAPSTPARPASVPPTPEPSTPALPAPVFLTPTASPALATPPDSGGTQTDYLAGRGWALALIPFFLLVVWLISRGRSRRPASSAPLVPAVSPAPADPPAAVELPAPAALPVAADLPAAVESPGSPTRVAEIPREEKAGTLPDDFKKSWDAPDALADLITAGLRNGSPAECLEGAEQLNRIDSKPERGASLLAATLLQLQRFEEAEKVLIEAIRRHGEKGVFLTNLARVLAGRGNPTGAERLLWRALKIDPNQDEGLLWYAAMQRERGGPEAELEAFRRVAEWPASWRPQLWLARHSLETKDVPAALARYREALARMQPVMADVLLQISGDLGNHGLLKEMIEICAPHFEARQHGLPVGYNLINAYLNVHDAPGARGILEQLSAAQRPDWREHLTLWEREVAKVEPGSGPVPGSGG